MGMLDFLKIGVKHPPKKPAKPKGPPRPNQSVVQVDSKSFPIAALTASGFAATGFDDSLIAGQNANVKLVIDDQFAKFSFDTMVNVANTSGGKLVAQFGMLKPEIESLLKKYVQMKKQGAAK